MTVTIDLKVAGLLCSRLCHDLIGPIGAVGNGIELMREMGAAEDREALDLVGVSAKTAARRLQFFRIAYGAGLGQGDGPAVAEIGALAADMLADTRIGLRWEIAGDAPLGRQGTRLAVNLILLLTEALPLGGTVACSLVGAPDGGLVLGIAAEGKGADLPDGSRAALDGRVEPAELTPRTVQGYYVRCLAAQMDTAVELRPEGGDRLVASVRLPAAA